MFKTYYMLDWSKVLQRDSDQTCVTCGQKMKEAEPLRDKRGLQYTGFLCHNCKVVYWVKS